MKPKVKLERKAENQEFIEEMDSDEEEKTEEKDLKVSSNIGKALISKKDDLKETKSQFTQPAVNTESTNDTKRIFGPLRPPENYVVPESYFDQESDRDLPEIEEKDNM